METIFYCTPADLLSLFQEIERTTPPPHPTHHPPHHP